MERDRRELAFDRSIIYLDRPNSDRRPGASGDGTVIDLQRYKILKAIRVVLNGQ